MAARKRILALLTVALLWSPTFLFIKIALKDIPPMSLTFLRLLGGAIILGCYGHFSGRRIFAVAREFWLPITVSALVTNLIPYLLCNLGESRVDSAVAAIIEGLVPMLTLITAWILGINRGLRWQQLMSIAIGFIGIAVIFYPSFQAGFNADAAGIGWLLLMSLHFAIGFSFYDKYLVKAPQFEATAAQVAIAAVVAAPLAYFSDGYSWIEGISAASLLCITGLATLGTGFGLVAFFKLLGDYGAEFAAMVTYVVLAVAVFLGVAFLGEELSLYTMVGAALIVLSMILASVGTEHDSVVQLGTADIAKR